MTRALNIHTPNQIVELTTGIYSVHALGGWGVKVGCFSIELKNTKTNRILLPREQFLRTQDYIYNRRSKKIFVIDIPERGDYCVVFKNQNHLSIKPSFLFAFKFFNEQIPNSDLEICIG